jgi:hypothetical protein
MARQMMLTHPIANCVMIAMVHLFFCARSRPFSSNGAAACPDIYLAEGLPSTDKITCDECNLSSLTH